VAVVAAVAVVLAVTAVLRCLTTRRRRGR